MAPDVLRPGSSAAVQLWKATNTKKWEQSLQKYSQCIQLVNENQSNAQNRISKVTFIEDDKWREEQLPMIMKKKKYLTLEDIQRLVRWKLRRGMYRPTLLGLIKRNQNDFVVKTTKSAFSDSVDTDSSLSNICLLQGVGPATASALISSYHPDKIAFMSDEAMDAALGLPRTYTLSQYKKFQKVMQEKAEELGDDWTPSTVEKALWCAAMIAKYSRK